MHLSLEEEKKEVNSFSIDEINLKSFNENDKILIEERFIRNDEKDFITFSKNGIINFLKSLDNENSVPWIPLYNKNNLILHYRKGVRDFYLT